MGFRFWASLPAMMALTTLGRAQEGIPAARPIGPPVLVIGNEGSPDYEFLRIRMAVRAPTGIAIVDASEQIRIYDSTGNLLRKIGRSGTGPGEFRRISEMIVAGDTLITYDFGLRRFTWFADTGALLKSILFNYPGDKGSLEITGRLSNGEWVVTNAHFGTWNTASAVWRDTTHVGTWSAFRGTVHWLGEFPGMTWFVHAPAGRKGSWRVGMLPFSPYPIIAGWQDFVIVGDLSETQLKYISSTGQTARTLQLPRLAPPSDLRPALEEALASERQEDSKAYFRLAYEAVAKTAKRIWERLVVADNGDLWLSVADPRPAAERSHIVLRPDGSIKTVWLLPPRSRLLSVRGSELLVATRDEDEIERVAVYRAR